MSSSDQERLDAISDALARILRRQEELDQRLHRLEHPEEPVLVHAPPPLPPPLPMVRPAPAAPPAPPKLPVLPPEAELPPKQLETKLGLNWINRIGVVTLLFAAAFGFDYAVENNWIGPGARVALGLAAAAVSAYFGDRMRQRAHEIFAQGLTGLGIALSYLTLYASFTLYHVFPQNLAFILMALTTGGAAALALRSGSQVIAILGLVGGYLTPILLSTGGDQPWILFSYAFLVNIGALFIGRTRGWQAVEYTAAGGTTLLYLGWFGDRFTTAKTDVATVFAIAFYTQFATSALVPVWTLAQILIALAIPSIWTAPAPVLLLALLCVAAGLAAAEVRRWTKAPAWTLLCYAITYLIWRSENKADHPEALFGLLSCVFVLFLAWILWRAISKTRPFDAAELLVVATNGAAYFAASYALLNPSYHDYMGAFAVLLGGIHLAVAKLLWSDDESLQWPGLLALAVTLAYLTLAIPIQFAGFRVTIAWSLEAAALAWLAARFHQQRLQFGAWIIFLLAGYHLLLFDAWVPTQSTILNARFMTFAVTAVSLWLAARAAGAGIEAAAPYVAGHAVLLWAFGLEIGGWAQRNVSAADLWSTESTAFSILLALYALVLILLGVATRTSLNRLLGLGLLGIVVVKLYLSDVWSLGLGFRITAFLALGILLLLVSYLYSRFKPVIERLWKDDR